MSDKAKATMTDPANGNPQSATEPPPVDLSVDLAGVKLACPLLTASGTCGYADEYADFVDLRRLGAFVTKSITLQPRAGNEYPRIVETRAGMLNAIGLANVGLERFLAEKVPLLERLGLPAFVNVAGTTIDDYVAVARRLDGVAPVRGIELNISCPNVKAGGIQFGTDPAQVLNRAGILLEEVKRLESKARTLSAQVARAAADELAAAAEEVGGVRLVHGYLPQLDAAELRVVADRVRETVAPPYAGFVAGALEGGRIRYLVFVSPDRQKASPAGKLAKAVGAAMSGGGGGRPELAEGGGAADRLDAGRQAFRASFAAGA